MAQWGHISRYYPAKSQTFTEADLLKEKLDVDALVSRFLAWKLPQSVCSDICVTDRNYQFPRSGTNLLTADEARQMIEYLFAPDRDHRRHEQGAR